MAYRNADIATLLAAEARVSAAFVCAADRTRLKQSFTEQKGLWCPPGD